MFSSNCIELLVGNPLGYGIGDIDIVCYDDNDLGREARLKS
jgi:hypothetical protein